MSRNRVSLAVLSLALLWACGGKGESQAGAADTTKRDLSLAPAESVAPLNDAPAKAPEAQQPRQPAPKPRPPAPKPQVQTPPPAKPVTPPAPPAPALAEGTTMNLMAADSVNSRHNKKGDLVTATAGADVRDPAGKVIIPAGAVFVGTISDIASGGPGNNGRLVLTFNRVQFDGKTYGITARVDTMATVMKGRGVTTSDAAKVGVGAVVGGIAGRIIGGNKTGTAVGAAAGAAAGVGVASATRDIDVVLPAGAMIRISLTGPFDLKPVD